VRRLRTEFETITFKDGEHIDEFGMRISNLASTLRSFGDVVNDEKIVRKFLSVVPTRFVQIAFSIETLLDPATKTVEEVVGHLRPVEKRVDGNHGAAGGQLLLSEQQWEERKKLRRSGGSGSSGNGRGHDSADTNSRRKGGQAQQKPATPPAVGDNADRDLCRYYKKKGHWARDCGKKKCDDAQRGMANLGIEEATDPTMMMAHIIEVTEPGVELHTAAAETGEFPAAGDTPIRSCSHFLCNEERAKLQPMHGGDVQDLAWYLDSGATDYMTGGKGAFAELDEKIFGKVRFGDGSVAAIADEAPSCSPSISSSKR
jgi:hypothetical protein